MGSGDWFKTIIGCKKTKQDRSKQVKGTSCQQSNGFKWRNQSRRKSNKLYNGCGSMSIEDLAAIRIQTAFRGFRARKKLLSLKGIEKLRVLAQGHSVKKQATTTLSYIQSWSKIQAQIRGRRICMVNEGRIRQKKQNNQLKLEAKLHVLEVEWCGGSETMEEILARIQQREEAAIKRERAMAYAFSHQWKANPGLNQGPFVYECGKGNWGWSWMDRWIAARPWETRMPTVIPKQAQTKSTSNVGKNTNPPSAEKVSDSVKPAATDMKGSTKRSSQSNDGKIVNREQIGKAAATSQQKTRDAKMKREQEIPTQTSEITALSLA